MDHGRQHHNLTLAILTLAGAAFSLQQTMAGMNTVVRMIGGVIGGQVGAALLTARTIGDSSVPAESAFTITFMLSAVTALIAAVITVSIGSRPARRQLEVAAPPAPASSGRTSAVRPQG